jgi:hypothetical protein
MKFDYYFSGRIHESLSAINIHPLLLYDSSFLLGQRAIVIPYGSRINKSSLLGRETGLVLTTFYYTTELSQSILMMIKRRAAANLVYGKSITSQRFYCHNISRKFWQ